VPNPSICSYYRLASSFVGQAFWQAIDITWGSKLLLMYIPGHV
jgi:hypothetical protein